MDCCQRYPGSVQKPDIRILLSFPICWLYPALYLIDIGLNLQQTCASRPNNSIDIVRSILRFALAYPRPCVMDNSNRKPWNQPPAPSQHGTNNGRNNRRLLDYLRNYFTTEMVRLFNNHGGLVGYLPLAIDIFYLVYKVNKHWRIGGPVIVEPRWSSYGRHPVLI